MVNLITPETRAKLTSRYYARLVTVIAAAAGFAFLTAAVLMLPTYFFIHAEADQAQEYVETANAIAAERAKGAAQETLATFHEGVKLLTGAARDSAFAHLMSLITEDMPRGVTLSLVRVTYTENGDATLGLEGAARTRAELIAYTQALKKINEFTAVEVPVADLVADVNSTFSVAIEWKRPLKP